MNNFIDNAKAQLNGQSIPLPNTSEPNMFTWQTVMDYIETIINLLLRMAGIVALVLFLYAAVIYVTAYGDESKAETAKKTMTWALIGLVIIGAASFIVSFVGSQISS